MAEPENQYPPLTEADELHRIVLLNISDAVFITDAQGMFTFICPNVNVIFGYTYEEVRDAGNIAAILGGTLINPTDLDTNGEILNLEHAITDKFGRSHILLINVKRVAIKHGTRLYTCRDITERKRVEESLHEYQAELAHATRLSTIGEMTSGLAHELNQPLAAISNFAKACANKMQSGQGDPAQMKNYLEQISTQSHRAGEIVQRVRNFARKQRMPFRAVDVCQAVRDSVNMLASSARKSGIDILVAAPPNVALAWGDVIGIQQVIINLISNAIEATQRADDCSKPVEVSIEQTPDTHVHIRVKDGGVGLSDETLQKVFDPFFTTKQSGMGLGLSISQSIVEEHGGELWATENESAGVTFHFTIPSA